MTITLNDLLAKEGIAPEEVIVFRHRPSERDLWRVFPWIAGERHDLFNAYQETQGLKVEGAMKRARYVASFIGHKPERALFVGFYSIESVRQISRKKYWSISAYGELKKLGMRGFTEEDKRETIGLFVLKRMAFLSTWKGKLVIDWPGAPISWWRLAHRNKFHVQAILESSAFASAMPEWENLKLKWHELGVIPTHWAEALSHWRGIYYIFDRGRGKGYVGAAYGAENILGRWKNYARSGHGGNSLLRHGNPADLSFSILQRVSPDMRIEDITALEQSWMDRLHSKAPFGLNDN